MRTTDTVAIVRVVLVSPSDVTPERNCLPRVIDELNRTIAKSRGLRLELWRWETDSFPAFHAEGPQGHLDDLMELTTSQIVIGIFWKRFGTPVSDANSGTEHELRRAVNLFREAGAPQVMIYFCERATMPKSPQELDQWKAVLEFRSSVENESGLYWTFTDTAEFETLVRTHLAQLIPRVEIPHQQTRPLQPASDFTPPDFAGQVTRSERLADLAGGCSSHPVFAVEGLPGSGKTFLLSRFAAQQASSKLYSTIYWHTPQENETLDETLIQLATALDLSGLSAEAKSRDLVAKLKRGHCLLVIDDFHSVNQDSFLPLLQSAVRVGSPAVILLISRTFVDATRTWPLIGHMEVGGFSLSELDSFLRTQHVSLERRTTKLLHERIDGLPLAASLFAILVGHFNREPMDLLRGEIGSFARLRGWFDDLNTRLTRDQQLLLKALSLYEGPFNHGVVRFACDHIGVTDTNETFEPLQRRYLVQRHTPFRWTVHHLIALFSTEETTPEAKQTFRRLFAKHCLRGIPVRPNIILPEDSAVWAIRAVRFYQKAGEQAKSAELLNRLAPTIKTRGLYRLYLSAAEHELENNASRDPWIDYHAAHCHLITGRLKRAFEIIEPLMSTVAPFDPDKRLAIARLYAELLASAGRFDVALLKLREALQATPLSHLRSTTISHARSLEVMLLTALSRHEEATKCCNELLAESMRRDDKRGAAVALSRLGVIEARTGDRSASLTHLEQSAEMFKECEDVRGRAWALTQLGEVLVDEGRLSAGARALGSGMALKNNISECSGDYRDLLVRLSSKQIPEHLAKRVRQELTRVDGLLRRHQLSAVSA